MDFKYVTIARELEFDIDAENAMAAIVNATDKYQDEIKPGNTGFLCDMMDRLGALEKTSPNNDTDNAELFNEFVETMIYLALVPAAGTDVSTPDDMLENLNKVRNVLIIGFWHNKEFRMNTVVYGHNDEPITTYFGDTKDIDMSVAVH